MLNDFENHDAMGLADLIRKGEVQAIEVVDAAIARIEKHNPALNAVVTTLFDRAREEATRPLGDGPLAGVPFLLKDLLATLEGVPTSNGNRFWKNVPASADSELVRRLRASGLIMVGKTNTPEFGLTPYTESRTLGPARNPWDLSRSPGGSSGGSAAAVAARMVPAASGGDGGGSIRIPASACGLFGMKPTRARTPLGPLFGEAWNGFAVEHALTRTVRDSALLLDVTHGPDIGAPYHAPAFTGSFLESVGWAPGRLRIAVSCKPMMGKSVDPEVVAAFESTVALLNSLGHEIIETAPEIDREQFSVDFMTVLAAELRADIEETAEAAGTSIRAADFDPQTIGLGMVGKGLSAADYARASRRLFETARRIGHFFETCDVLLTPVLARPPIKVGELAPSASEERLIRIMAAIDGGFILKRLGIVKELAATTYEYMPWTAVFNVTGQPAMSVPLAWSKAGLPIGMQFVGRFGDEATLFSLARQLELAAPWADRKPPLT
ncbi:amidase [Rhizobium alvei]|uniref:Indoleacetamide hydrolase n=1 Tax=Rhizobium alvei TaxID=1132659 RepID=A0ABT8YF38_9HYPH|nr:amidase [Rhizobium alvei]MDO6962338.1 amidase [Rhizobium alvei]